LEDGWTTGESINELNALTDNFGFEGVAALAGSSTPPAPAPGSRRLLQYLPRNSAPGQSKARRSFSPKNNRHKPNARKGEQRGAEEGRQAKFRESLSQLKVFLMEAMANHGDSHRGQAQ
jgi:hypothetical protein